MNTPPQEGSPAPQPQDVTKVLEELKAANVALLEKVSALEEKNKAYDAKITAMSQPAPAPGQASVPAAVSPEEKAKQDLDLAYQKVLEELGLKKKE